MTDYEHLIDVYEITEMRDGCVYRTKRIGMRWVPLDSPPPQGLIYASPPTEYVKDNPMTIRRVTK